MNCIKLDLTSEPGRIRLEQLQIQRVKLTTHERNRRTYTYAKTGWGTRERNTYISDRAAILCASAHSKASSEY